jgi:hypothetical protein
MAFKATFLLHAFGTKAWEFKIERVMIRKHKIFVCFEISRSGRAKFGKEFAAKLTPTSWTSQLLSPIFAVSSIEVRQEIKVLWPVCM